MRNILFDVDGVLIHGYHAKPSLQHCWDETIETDLGIDRDHFKTHFIFKDFVKKVIIGQLDLKQALETYLPTIGFHQDPQIVIDYWMEHDTKVNHDLIEKINILKKNKENRLFIATNQEHNRARYLMDNLGFGNYFEDIFYAAKIGSLKPSVEFFTYIQDRLPQSNYPPILFDDTQKIIDAANDFGWQAYQYDTVADLNKCEYIQSITT